MKKISDILKSKEGKSINSNNSNNYAIFWTVLVPPYGLYLLYKYKILNKWIIAFISLVFVFAIILAFDSNLNPNRVYDREAKKIMTNEGLGTVRKVLKSEDITIGENKYHNYIITTTEGKYTVYLNSEDGKGYNVKDIYELYPERKHIKGDITDKFFPEVVKFFNHDNSYGTLNELIKNNSDSSQTIKTDKGEYIVNIINGQIGSIYTNENSTSNAVYINNDAKFEVMSEVKKVFNEKKYGKIIEAVNYEFGKDSETQYITTENGLFKVVVNDDGSAEILKASN